MDVERQAGPPAPAKVGRSLTARATSYAWRTALVVGVALGGLWSATHGVAGVAWSEVATVIGGVTVGRLLLLAAIWFGGLVIYSTVLAGSLPGLGMRRGLLLNLTGSAVSNVMPLGGAVGTALNWRMVRTWGHSDTAFASYFVLTNALDVLSKLVLPPLAVAGLVAVSMKVPAYVWAMAGTCAAVLLLAALVQAWLTHRGAVPRSSEEPDVGSSGRGWWVATRRHVVDVVVRVQAQLGDHWPRLLPASAAYLAAQILLLQVSLRSVGVHAALTIVVMAAAIERLGSLVPITPAGMGVAELGTIAWLVANGLDPVGVVAGVLLYRVFMVLLEIPVGGVLLTGWAWLHRGAPPVEPVVAEPPTVRAA